MSVLGAWYTYRKEINGVWVEKFGYVDVVSMDHIGQSTPDVMAFIEVVLKVISGRLGPAYNSFIVQSDGGPGFNSLDLVEFVYQGNRSHWSDISSHPIVILSWVYSESQMGKTAVDCHNSYISKLIELYVDRGGAVTTPRRLFNSLTGARLGLPSDRKVPFVNGISQTTTVIVSIVNTRPVKFPEGNGFKTQIKMQARRVHEIVWIDGSKLNVDTNGSYVLAPGVQSERVSVFGQSGCQSESVWMSSPKISAWRGCLAPETGFFRTGAALDVSGDQVYFSARAKHEPRARARRADSVQEDDESEDEGEATTLESRMVIAFKSLADPAQLAVLATTVFFQSSSMTTSRMLNALVEGEISGLASKGWNASAIASNVLGVDSLWWAQPDYKVRVTLPESVLAQITQWLKESKLNNSKVSNYEVQERILSGRDRDWELRALATVGRVTRLIASGLKNAGGVKKRKSPSDPEHAEAADEVQPSKKRGRKSTTQKTQDAKEAIRGSKRAERSTPVSAASVPKSRKVKHGWSVVPVSGSAGPVSLVCDGARKRMANSRYTDE
jgi:hypothetical protein